jgi:hypothetical protein
MIRWGFCSMIDFVVAGVQWFMLVFFGAQAITFVGLLLWSFWTDSIKPRLVSSAVVEREADTIIAAYLDPEEEAFARHEQAWYRSDGAAQTYWYRVRKAVRRKLTSEKR